MSKYEVIRTGGAPTWLQQVRSYFMGPLTAKSPELARLWAGSAASAGVSISEQSALNYSAVWAAVSIISSDVASLPLILYKRAGRGKERFDAHPLYRVLHDEPNPEMTSMVFRETLQAHVLTWGNGYAEIVRNGGGQVSELWPLLPNVVQTFRQDGRLKYRVKRTDGGQDIFEAKDILHVPGLGFDGHVGYSVIDKAREAIGLGIATERFGGEFFGNGSTMGGVFEHPGKMSPLAQKNFRESVTARHEGTGKAHKFLVVEEGMKYQALGIPPDNAQFLETRKFQVNEIARWFGIPPHKLGDLERATFSNIEQQDIEYYKGGLRRWLVRWEQEINRKLISRPERNIQFAEHLVEGILRGDSQARAEYYSKMFGIGAFSINDILEKENQNPIGAEGDQHFVPANMWPADKVPDPTKRVEPAVPAQEPKPADPALKARVAVLEVELATAMAEGLASADRAAALGVDLATAVSAHMDTATERDGLRQQLAGLLSQLDVLAQAEATLVGERDAALAAQADAAVQFTRREADLTAAAEASRAAVLASHEAAVAGLSERLEAVRGDLSQAMELLDGARSALAAEQAERARESEANGAAVALIGQLRDQAVVDRDAALTQAAEAAQRESMAQAMREVAETARAITEAALASERAAEATRLMALVAANRAVVVDAVGRLVRRETEKARRHQATPEKLRTWAASFYDGMHTEMCREALQPAMQAHLALLGADDDPATVAGALVEQHLQAAQRQLLSVADADPDDFHEELGKLLLRWETQRPNAVADALLVKELNHVRTYR